MKPLAVRQKSKRQNPADYGKAYFAISLRFHFRL